MDELRIAFTAVYLKTDGGYLGFIEELPNVNSHGHTLEEARSLLAQVAAVVFDEERREAEALLKDREVLREAFYLPLR